MKSGSRHEFTRISESIISLFCVAHKIHMRCFLHPNSTCAKSKKNLHGFGSLPNLGQNTLFLFSYRILFALPATGTASFSLKFDERFLFLQ